MTVKYHHPSTLSLRFAKLNKRTAKQDAHGFATRCFDLLSKAGVAGRDDFKEHFPVDCSVYGVSQSLHFDYGLGNGHPEALWHRVFLKNEQSVTSSATKLHSLIINSSVLPRKFCRALIRKSDMTTKAANESYRMLKGICDVVDIDSDTAVEELAEIAPKVRD